MSKHAARCVFCEIVAGDAPANVMRKWAHAIAITPLNPVTAGHTLVIPRQHLADARRDPMFTGLVAACAAELATDMGGDFNLIVNAGPTATQTVWHLHWHVVPRRSNDGLHLPWTGQHIA